MRCCLPRSPYCQSVVKVSLSLLMLTVQTPSSSCFLPACQVDICSLDDGQPHQSFTFLLLVKSFVGACHCTDDTVPSPVLSCCELNNKMKLFKCQNVKRKKILASVLADLYLMSTTHPEPAASLKFERRPFSPVQWASCVSLSLSICLSNSLFHSLFIFNLTPRVTEIQEIYWPFWPHTVLPHLSCLVISNCQV